MIIYGINSVNEALDSDVEVKRVYVSDRMDSRIRDIVSSAKGKGVKIVRKDKEFFRNIKVKAVQYVAAEVNRFNTAHRQTKTALLLAERFFVIFEV